MSWSTQNCLLTCILCLSPHSSFVRSLVRMARLSFDAKSIIKSRKNIFYKLFSHKNSSFYESTRYIFGFAQGFAVMPLTGLWRKENGLKGLKFRWGSINTVYCVFCIISIGAMCVISVMSTVAQFGLKIGKICKEKKFFNFHEILHQILNYSTVSVLCR